MNVEEANDLLSQIFAYNKIFFEEHLGIRLEIPDLKLLVDSNLESLQRNEEHQQLKVSHDANKNKGENENFNEKENWKMLQHVFETISGSMGYLMDKDLPAVLELSNMTCKEKKLAQLDNVFSVRFLIDEAHGISAWHPQLTSIYFSGSRLRTFKKFNETFQKPTTFSSLFTLRG